MGVCTGRRQSADVSILSHKLCDPTLEKSHLHESQVTINCENGQLKEYRLCGERHPPNFRENIHNTPGEENKRNEEGKSEEG